MMNSIVLAIPDQNRGHWLELAAKTRAFRKIEMSWEGFLAPEAEDGILAERGLDLVAIRDLIASEVTRNLVGLSNQMRQQAQAILSARLVEIRNREVRTAIFDLGVGRNVGDGGDFNFARRVKFMRDLMAVAASQEVKVCLQARYPRAYPTAPQWDMVGNVIHEVMHPNCRLALDLYAAELPPGFQVRDFLRRCGCHLSVLRLHFEPMAGEGLSGGFIEQWREALDGYLFKGMVVFSPDGSIEAGSILGLLRRMRQWAVAMTPLEQS